MKFPFSQSQSPPNKKMTSSKSNSHFSISQSSRTTSKTTTSSSVTSSNPINAPPPTATSSSSVLPSTSSEPPPPASAPPRISIYHKMVPSKSKFRQCDVCEHIFIFDFVRKQHLDDVYACNVCGWVCWGNYWFFGPKNTGKLAKNWKFSCKNTEFQQQKKIEFSDFFSQKITWKSA